MSAHTPGKWNWNHGTDCYFVQADDGLLVADCVMEKDDARLIAAAPDLLKALNALSASLPMNHTIPARVVDQCRAAIAKARGES